MDLNIIAEMESYLFINIQENLLYFSIFFAAVIGKIKESSKKIFYLHGQYT